MLKNTAAAAAVFSTVPSRVLGKISGTTAPSDVHPRAILGWGSQAHGDYGTFSETDAPVIATAEVDDSQAGDAHGQVYKDWREVISRTDIDFVQICTPPHWHALMAIAAADAGMDVWCEKPMTRTIGEGIRVVDACARNNTTFRINTWFRLYGSFYGFGTPVEPLKKLLSSDILTKPVKIRVSSATGFDWKLSMWSGNPNLGPNPVPDTLDYDMWLGPAPFKSYNSQRLHLNFRGYWDYDGGGLGDMGMHYLDPVQYILGKDDTSPVEIIPDPINVKQHPFAAYPWNRITLRYADGDEIILEDGLDGMSDHFIEDADGNYVQPNFASNISNLAQTIDALPAPPSMNTDFIWCMENKPEKFGLNEVNGFRSCTIINLAVTAARLGRTLNFDPENLQFINDDQANRLIWQPMRAPWRLPDESYAKDFF
jgi:hypothetical protein